jgi:long-chain acyl-CoA synthetase
MQDMNDTRMGIAGMPVTCCEIKLVSTPEVGDKAGQPYLSTDRFDVEGNPIFGRGEIITRGTSVSCGYYMQPEMSKEEYREDGWFYTGDIGQFMNDGSLRIVDRKKNLVKLKGGEYVALEKMEGVYGNSNFVDAIAGGICCCADGDMDRPVAIMQLNATVSMTWAKANGLAGDFDTVKDSKELYAAIMKDMHAQQKKSDLSHLEKIIAVALLTTPWTPENGCLTAANKLQRRTVVQQYEKEFEEVKKKGVFA